MKAIIFDIDGTLSLVGERAKYLQQSPKDWDAFYEACYQDESNKPIVALYKNLYCVREIYKTKFILLTGRRENTRDMTNEWLWFHKIGYDMLLMRPDGDFRPDTEVKPELIKGLGIIDPIIFEDRNSMVQKWRSMGHTCVQVADGNF